MTQVPFEGSNVFPNVEPKSEAELQKLYKRRAAHMHDAIILMSDVRYICLNFGCAGTRRTRVLSCASL